VLRRFGEQSRRLEAKSAREKKGGKGGVPELFIGGGCLAGGGRVRAREARLDGRRHSRAGGGVPGRMEMMTGGPGSSASGGENNVPLRGSVWLGHGPNARLGRFGPPGPFPISDFFFIFTFMFFLFLLYNLQKCFKSIQTSFRNFLIISTLF
jgi:hypothetical protein